MTATSTAKPRIALEIGSETVWAVWKAGQGAGTVHRFEYTVAEGDLDTDGVAVKRNSLETPTGSSIVTTDDSEEVSLGHGFRQDPARPVDGVRPTAMSARSEGPSVSVEWSEALNPGAIPSGAGGFSVDVPGASNPTVTAIAVVRNVVTLSLNTPIALGTTGVTANYRPTSTPLRDTAGNAATAFANALAVTVAADETAPVLSAAVVDGPLLTLIYNEPLKATSPVNSRGDQVFAGFHGRRRCLGVHRVGRSGRCRAGQHPRHHDPQSAGPGRTDARCWGTFERVRHCGVQGPGPRRKRKPPGFAQLSLSSTRPSWWTTARRR